MPTSPITPLNVALATAALLLSAPLAYAQPEFDTDPAKEQPTLSDIRQLTTADMGFEKSGEAYFSHDGNSVIFQAVPTGEKHYQIFTIPAAGGTPRMVSTGRGACTCAYFHPNGDKIIFASSHEDPRIDDPTIETPVPGYKREGRDYAWDFNPYMDIYEANPDGSALKPLIQAHGYDAEGAYSNDGKMIAFASNRTGHMNLYTANADGSNLKQLTKVDGCYNGGPFISPDGKRVIFRADRDHKDYLQIFMIDIDGKNEVQLTDNGAVNWAPYWHPNGKVIAFTTSLHGHSNYEVYLMNVETKKMARVTHSPRFDGLPVFSNDGKYLMWTSQRSPNGASQVFIATFTIPQNLLD